MPPTQAPTTTRPPRENLVRAASRGFELRATTDDATGMPTLFGHFLRFNEWTEIDSVFEGRFMERFAPGSVDKTFAESRSSMRILFQHGRDPQVGDKPLAPIDELRADSVGAYYEGQLLDTAYNRELIPGLEAGQYGASFRFRVMREEIVDDPGVSDHNPDGIPERTVTEAQVYEFGPVTFPAYANASAGVRSLTDEFMIDRFAHEPARLARALEYVRDEDAPGRTGAAPKGTPAPPRRETPAPPAPTPAPSPTPAPAPAARQEDHPMPPTAVDLDRFTTIDDLTARQGEVQSRLDAIAAEWGTRELDADTQGEFDSLVDEKRAIANRLNVLEQRQAAVLEGVERGSTQPGTPPAPSRPASSSSRVAGAGRSRLPENVFELGAYRQAARNAEDEVALMRDGARVVIERAVFPHKDADGDAVRTHLERLLERNDDDEGTIAKHILLTGSERYSRAFGKYLSGTPRSPEEERALSLTGSAGGFAVPFTLDPTIIPTSNLAVNPWRAIARVESIPGDEWRGVSSSGVTAAYAAEATETTDNAPTVAQPTVSTEKAQAFIPFSIEVGMDWSGLQSEMAGLLQDAKDELEATKFTTGTGTNEPQGLITGATTTVTAGGVGAFAVADLYALEAAVPPRFRARAAIVMNRAIAQKIRQFDTAGGANLWIDNLQTGLNNGVPTPGGYGSRVLGYPAFESTAMAAVLTTGSKIAVMGDFRYYLIADRIGLTVEVIPHLVGTNHRPTGQRGIYAYWRNGAGVLSASAFRVLVTG